MFKLTPQEKAYLGPFFAFLGGLLLCELISKFSDGFAVPWWLSDPQYWVYPLQTLVCGGLVLRNRRYYNLAAFAGMGWALGGGLVVLALWIAPQVWLGAAPRTEGFDPTFFGESGWPYYTTLIFRLIRLAIVVPLVEEIFWRGFLLRYLVRQPFHTVPIGAWSWSSFGIVSVGFMLEHAPADWPAAILAGMLYNLVAYRTRSLSACVLAHAVTNALLGWYVLSTRQWGFW